MPIRNESDLHRIKADIAKCRLRIEQMTAGKVGVIPEGSHHVNAGQAFENQLKAHHSTLARLEAEFVNAMLAEHQWSPAQIIVAMEGRNIRESLTALLKSNTFAVISRSDLEALLTPAGSTWSPAPPAAPVKDGWDTPGMQRRG